MTAEGEVPAASGRGPLTAVSWLDWKLGARMLLKYPALTIIGGLSLAAAIAIGVVGIEVAGELLYKRLPFDEGSRVVRLETQDAAASRVEPRVLHDFAIWRRSLKTVAELGAARVSERNVLTGEGRVEALRVAEITASAFPLTRVPPLLGRPLQPTDEMQGAEPVVVLGYDVWQRQFLHDPAIIGRVVTVGRTARTVVGVMPPRFGFPHNQQVWVPLPVQDAPPREGPAVQVFGRLADGASWQDAAAELDVVSARLAADQPTTHAQLRTRVRAFAGRTPGDPLRLEDLADPRHRPAAAGGGLGERRDADLRAHGDARIGDGRPPRAGGEPCPRDRADRHRRARAGPRRCRARARRGPDDRALCLGPGESDHWGRTCRSGWI